MKANVLRFIGLFAAIVGLIGTMAAIAALFFVTLPARDRGFVETWIWLPIALLVAGVVITLSARSFRLRGALAQLERKPFFLEYISASDPTKLGELWRDYPDVYGLGTAPGLLGPPKYFREPPAIRDRR